MAYLTIKIADRKAGEADLRLEVLKRPDLRSCGTADGTNPHADHAVQYDLLTTLSSYQDLYWTKMDIKSRRPSRQATTLHCLNHILK